MMGLCATRDQAGLLDPFGYVRVINLPARADRRHSVIAQLAAIGASIDGRTIDYREAVRPDDAGAFDAIGTRGCFLSHLDTLRAARQEGVSHLLILEDDVGFSRSERAAMPAAFAALWRQHWDVFYGGSPVRPDGSPLTRIAPDTPVMLAHMIAFSASAIDRLIPFLEAMLARPRGSPDGGPMHVDGAYNWFRRANPDMVAFAATPHVAHQTASRTDIHQLRGADRITVLGPVLRLVRAGKNLLRMRD